MGRFDLFLSLGGVAFLIWLAILLVRSKLARKYPFFFAYITFSILATTIVISVSGSYQIFLVVYWITEAFHAVLALLALHEAFHDVFLQDFRDWWWFWMVFPATVLVLSVVFIGNALLHPPIQASPFAAVILSFATVVNCVKGGLFLMFLLLAWLLLGKSWPTYPYGVVTGFAVSALGSLVAYWARSVFGTKFNPLVKYGPPVAYILAVVVWIASCYLPPEPKNRWANFTDPERGVATVRQYIRALKWIAGKR